MGRNLMAGAADDYDHVSTLYTWHKLGHVCCWPGRFQWVYSCASTPVDVNQRYHRDDAALAL